jgi:hypothetical protein
MKRSKHWPAKDATEMHLKGLLIRKDPYKGSIVPCVHHRASEFDLVAS